MTRTDDRRGRVPAPMPAPRRPIAKAAALLAWMVDEPSDAWGVREVARGTGFAPTTVHRLLTALEAAGLVSFDPRSERYSLGLEFLRISLRNAAKVRVPSIAQPHLSSLAAEFDETAFLVLYDPVRREVMFAAAVESTNPLRYVVRLHEWIAIDAGASGLAILANLPSDVRGQILRDPAKGRTASEVARFEDELAAIRRNGYARTEGQRVPGAVGLAAPIFAAAGSVVGDVGISVPSQRYGSYREPELAKAVQHCASQVTEAIGGIQVPHAVDETLGTGSRGAADIGRQLRASSARGGGATKTDPVSSR